MGTSSSVLQDYTSYEQQLAQYYGSGQQGAYPIAPQDIGGSSRSAGPVQGSLNPQDLTSATPQNAIGPYLNPQFNYDMWLQQATSWNPNYLGGVPGQVTGPISMIPGAGQSYQPNIAPYGLPASMLPGGRGLYNTNPGAVSPYGAGAAAGGGGVPGYSPTVGRQNPTGAGSAGSSPIGGGAGYGGTGVPGSVGGGGAGATPGVPLGPGGIGNNVPLPPAAQNPISTPPLAPVAMNTPTNPSPTGVTNPLTPYSPGGGSPFTMPSQSAYSSPADAWLSTQAMNNMNPLQGFASGTNPMQQLLASGATPNSNALQNIVSGGGNPINQLPAWQSMVAAQQRNIQEGQAQLQAQFDVGGNRFSSAFGTAATDYQTQAQLNQNALLGQMTATAGENAQNRLLSAGSQLGQMGLTGLNAAAGMGYGAAGTLGQFGYGGASQLSSQDFQSQMQQYQAMLNASQTLAGGADTAASQLASMGYGGVNTLNTGALTGAQGLFGSENTAALNMFGAQNQMMPAYMNYLLGAQGQGIQGAADLSQLWNQNLQTGGQLGAQQYNTLQSQINNAYQQWLYQQPQNNPLLSMMYSAATSFPSPVYPGYQPGALSSLMGAMGSIGGGLLGNTALFSDQRMKENIRKIGEVMDLPIYSYNFKGTDMPRIGFMAQEVEKDYPSAVIKGDETHPWMIRPGVLSQLLTQRASA